MQLIEKYIYEYAFRNGYQKLIKENFTYANCLQSSNDADISLHTVFQIVSDKDYANFDVAWRLAEDLLNKSKTNDDQSAFKRLVFYLKYMHVLSTIGKESADRVVNLVLTYFDVPQPLSDFDGDQEKSLKDAFIKHWMKDSREYILRLLVRADRQKHFKNAKFPDTFNKLIEEINYLIELLTLRLRDLAAPCDLELLHNGNAKHTKDPSVLLFLNHFPKSRDRFTEDSLVDFLKVLQDSQMTITQPPLVIPPSSPASSTIRRNTRSMKPEEENEEPPGKRKRLQEDGFHDYQLSLTSTSGSEDLFPSLDRLMNKKGVDETFGTRECHVILTRLTEEEIIQICRKV